MLRQRLASAEAQALEALEQLRLSEARLAQFEHELAQFKRLVFGTRRERFVPTPDAGPLHEQPFSQALPSPQKKSAAIEALTPKPPRRKPVRQAFPSHLPREVITIEPEGDLTGLKKIGEEITETLDYRPARLVVIRRVRPKYVDPRDESRGVIIAELPPRPIEKGLAEPSLLAHVVIEKYARASCRWCRQVQRFRRAGITLSDSTLGDFRRGYGRLGRTALRGVEEGSARQRVYPGR